MFANGTEYYYFLESYCEKCERYVDWMEATKENQVCPIEEAMASCSVTAENFPKEVTREKGKWTCSCFKEAQE